MRLFGRIIFSQPQLQTEYELSCPSCGVKRSDLPAPKCVCQSAFRLVQKRVKVVHTFVLLQDSGQKQTFYSHEEVPLGSLQSLEIDADLFTRRRQEAALVDQQSLQSLTNFSDLPKPFPLRDAKCQFHEQEILSYLMNFSKQVLLSVQQIWFGDQLAFWFLKLLLAVLTNDFVQISASNHVQLSGIVEKLLDCLQQNSRVKVLNGVERLLSQKQDSAEFAEIGPFSVFYLNDLAANLQKSALALLVRNGFKTEIAVQLKAGEQAAPLETDKVGKDQTIVHVQMDFPCVVVQGGDEELQMKKTAHKFQPDLTFLHRYCQLASQEYVELKIEKNCKLCNGIMLLLNAAQISPGVIKAAETVALKEYKPNSRPVK